MKKLEQIELKNNQNLIQEDKAQKITIKVNTDNFLKKVIYIPILVNQIVSNHDDGS